VSAPTTLRIPARELRTWHRPRPRSTTPEEWHALLAESLRMGDIDAVTDLQGMACSLWEMWGAPEDGLLKRRMREVRVRTMGQPFVLETSSGPLFLVNAVQWFFAKGRWNGDWRHALIARPGKPGIAKGPDRTEGAPNLARIARATAA
jgi:hypothetical protein